MEARAEFEQTGNPAVRDNAAAALPDRPGQNSEQRRLPGPVPADQSERLAARKRERNVAHRPEIALDGLVTLESIAPGPKHIATIADRFACPCVASRETSPQAAASTEPV
jgi:hypothetical protein